MLLSRQCVSVSDDAPLWRLMSDMFPTKLMIMCTPHNNREQVKARCKYDYRSQIVGSCLKIAETKQPDLDIYLQILFTKITLKDFVLNIANDVDECEVGIFADTHRDEIISNYEPMSSQFFQRISNNFTYLLKKNNKKVIDIIKMAIETNLNDSCVLSYADDPEIVMCVESTVDSVISSKMGFLHADAELALADGYSWLPHNVHRLQAMHAFATHWPKDWGENDCGKSVQTGFGFSAYYPAGMLY